MNSIYRCSNSCANHSSSHWTGLCFRDSSCFRDQSTFLNFLKRWPWTPHPAQPCRLLWPASLLNSPCNPLAPWAPSRGEDPLPWTTLLPDILTCHWSQGQLLPGQQLDATWAQGIRFGAMKKTAVQPRVLLFGFLYSCFLAYSRLHF